MDSAGNDLLEPFRPRRRKLAALKADKEETFGHRRFPKSPNNLDIIREATEQVNDFQTALLKIIYDHRAFQKLKENMRKKHRSGFAAQQVVYKLVMEKNTTQIPYNEAIDSVGEETLLLFQQHMTNTKGVDRNKFMAEIKKSLSHATEDFRSKMSLLRNQSSFPSMKKLIQTPPCA